MSETVDKTAEVADPVVAAAVTDAAPATALTTDPAGDKPVAVQATWPDDWRVRMAGGDEARLKRLDRFADPVALAKSLDEAEKKMRSTRAVTPPPGADAKPEDLTAWRAEHGIPEAPAGYLEKLPDGLVIGDADKPLMEKFVTDMHGANADPAFVHKALASYYKIQADQVSARAEADNAAVRSFEDTMRPEWGPDYRRHINAISGFLDGAGPDVRAVLANARGGNGTPIMSDPKVMQWFLGVAMDANPAATIVPGAGAAAGIGVDERLAAIEATMGTRAYTHNEAVQKEYRDLIVVQQRLKARA